MSSNPANGERFSLRRWSQRKLEAARTEVSTRSQTAPSHAASATVQPPATSAGAPAPASPASVSVSADAQLPPIESLTIDSDFAPFFRPQVDESLKRAALKQLFRDPRFNVMDGLDTYVDDYTRADPIPPAMLDDLMQRRVFFPPPASDIEPRDDAVEPTTRDPNASPTEATAAPAAVTSSVAPSASPSPVAPTESDAGAKSGDS